MPRQLTFDWPHGEAMGEDSFFVTDANRNAHALVMNPGAWPEHKLILIGPPGSGKTHLARLFADRTGAQIRPAAELRGPFPDGPTVIEDAQTLPPAAQEWLFHAHNRLRAAAQPLLLTARTAPSGWPLSLRDLVSRMQAATTIRIEAPDDMLLGAVMMKLFEDRQLTPSPDVLPYLLPRMERSFQAAHRLVQALDDTALTEGRAINRQLARQVLDSLTAQKQTSSHTRHEDRR